MKQREPRHDDVVQRAAGLAGVLLRINVDTVGAIAGFAVVKGHVTRNQEVIAEGEIKLWIQSENQLEPGTS